MSTPSAYVHLVYERLGHGDLMRETKEMNPEGHAVGDSAFPPDALPTTLAVLSLHHILRVDITSSGVSINGSELRELEGARLLVEVATGGLKKDLSMRERVALVNETVDTLARHFFCRLGRRLPMPEEEREGPEEES